MIARNSQQHKLREQQPRQAAELLAKALAAGVSFRGHNK